MNEHRVTRAEIAGLTGVALLPEDDGFAAECATFNAAVRHAPAVAVGARRAADVRAAVRFAADRGRPVAVLGTGHGSRPPPHDAVLITTRRMTEVAVDPARRRVRIEGGVRWGAVVEAAARHGLAPLNGSASTVGVVGYTLGGGLSGTLGRAYGWAADHVTALDVVTADGLLRHATATTEPGLFWALRGAGAALGVVTAMEFGLFPVTSLYGGTLVFAGSDAEAVLTAYADLTSAAPDRLTTSIAFTRLPDRPAFPPPVRGAFTVQVRVSWLGGPDEGDALLRPLRLAAPPLADSVREMPYTAYESIYADPASPLPFAERTVTLGPLGPDLVQRLVEEVGPGTRDAPAIVSIRHLGGALGRPSAAGGAIGVRHGEFALWVIALGTPEATTPAMRWAGDLFGALRPWTVPGRLMNFQGHDGGPAAMRAAYPEAMFRRLTGIKAEYDPGNLFRLAPPH